MNTATQVREKILQLQDLLLSNHPRMPTLLREIHCIIKEDPEVVTVLEEPEICAILLNGLKKQVNVEIVSATIKGKPKKNIGVDDI